jgi:aldehyde dehydrogenase family 7 protein A1
MLTLPTPTSSEGVGEVVETIDVCDLACGLGRTMSGQIIPSERADHVIFETWRPVGLQGSGVAVLTAFNFPNAVLGWNAAIALVTGNCVLWKGAPTANLISIATARIFQDVLEANGLPAGIFTLIQGDGPTVGAKIVADKRFPLISFTGSSRVGALVAAEVAKDVGRTHLLELSGNNASVVMPDADLDMAVKSSLFGAVGTAGQRCTSLRRLLVHAEVYDTVVERLVKGYKSVRVGSPLEDGTLLGPVHTEAAVEQYLDGVKRAVAQGGKLLAGGERIDRPGFYVSPALIEFTEHAPIMHEELFVPILYVLKINSYEEGVRLNNCVEQGLSSCLYTKDSRLMMRWIGSGPDSCDTGLRNVNSGTSGAEIGGAFGGNKATGNGRESGSDSWKQYCTRGTACISYSNTLALAQGVTFD